MEEADGSRSRRPHTKSRKGCRTCKRRHIRCDETLPQCQNCVKHKCLCDYLEQPAEKTSPQSSMADLIWTPEADAILEQWQMTGICTLGGNVQVNLHSLDHKYTKSELLLIYHSLRMERAPRANTYTVWTGMTPRFLAIAAEHAFLMHAIFSFAGAALTFESQASDAKSVVYHHGGLALNGLQNAINMFSDKNGDAILGASLLLSWQANDWKSWSSLITGIRTVVKSMRSWKLKSLLPDLIDELEAAIPDDFAVNSNFVIQQQKYEVILQQIYFAFGAIKQLFVEREDETRWIQQIQEYFGRLHDVKPAQTAEEQFDHLLPYRKWLFWIPSNTLKFIYGGDRVTLILLAHLYAAALAIEPLYPIVAPTFSSLLVLRPLKEIINTFDLHKNSGPPDVQLEYMLHVMEYPTRIASEYQPYRQIQDR